MVPLACRKIRCADNHGGHREHDLYRPRCHLPRSASRVAVQGMLPHFFPVVGKKRGNTAKKARQRGLLAPPLETPAQRQNGRGVRTGGHLPLKGEGFKSAPLWLPCVKGAVSRQAD